MKPKMPMKPMMPKKPKMPWKPRIKTAIDNKAALRWLLGAALVGGGLRTAVSVAHGLNAAPTVPVRAHTDLYDPEIDIPVDMTPEQMKRYKDLQANPGKTAAWDTTINTLAGVGGGLAGWNLVDSFVKTRRRKALDAKILALKKQLSDLGATDAPDVIPGDDDSAKMAAAWDVLEIMASRYEAYVAGNPEAQTFLRAEKNAVVNEILEGAVNAGKALHGLDPMTKVLAGGGTAIAGVPFIPGVRSAMDTAGSRFTSALSGVGKAALKPALYGAIAALGPIAMLSALYGLNRGFSTAKERDPKLNDLKAIRAQIREREIAETPYFKLEPREVPDPKDQP
jgi:hypothetical protein